MAAVTYFASVKDATIGNVPEADIAPLRLFVSFYKATFQVEAVLKGIDACYLSDWRTSSTALTFPLSDAHENKVPPKPSSKSLSPSKASSSSVCPFLTTTQIAVLNCSGLWYSLQPRRKAIVVKLHYSPSPRHRKWVCDHRHL